MKKVAPLHDRVLVRRISEEETTKGGIVIPDVAKEKPQEGEVVAHGTGRILEHGERMALDVTVGCHVLYGKYSGAEIRVGTEDLLILREDEILAIVSDDGQPEPVAEAVATGVQVDEATAAPAWPSEDPRDKADA